MSLYLLVMHSLEEIIRHLFDRFHIGSVHIAYLFISWIIVLFELPKNSLRTTKLSLYADKIIGQEMQWSILWCFFGLSFRQTIWFYCLSTWNQFVIKSFSAINYVVWLNFNLGIEIYQVLIVDVIKTLLPILRIVIKIHKWILILFAFHSSIENLCVLYNIYSTGCSASSGAHRGHLWNHFKYFFVKSTTLLQVNKNPISKPCM